MEIEIGNTEIEIGNTEMEWVYEHQTAIEGLGLKWYW